LWVQIPGVEAYSPPLFQTIRVIAAILRARVSRAISGFIPLLIRAA
jgi:hypothetical protein